MTVHATEVRSALMVGQWMGGLILVELATRVPSRVASSTFPSAMSPDPEGGFGENFFADTARDPVEATLLAMESPSQADRDFVMTEAGAGHQTAAMRFGWPGHEALHAIHAPTVIVHGTADRVLPTAHARAFAADLAIAPMRGPRWASRGKLTSPHGELDETRARRRVRAVPGSRRASRRHR